MMTLQQMRESKGIMKGAAAKALGISYPTYRKIERDPRRMTVLQLNKLCDFLGCRREDIFLD